MYRSIFLMVVAVVTMATACGQPANGGAGPRDVREARDRGTDLAPDGNAGNNEDTGTDEAPPPPPDDTRVYAHNATDLFQVHPVTLQITRVGRFIWPLLPDQMTDIAINRDGEMVGISFSMVYAVDPATARCTFLSMLDRQFNGLSFLPDENDPDAPEVLIAAALDGTLYRLDPATGRSTPAGAYGGGYQSSGDIVSVRDFGTVATIKRPGRVGTDLLARIDPATGVATPIGDTGVSDIWGLAFWGDRVYGFTSAGQFVLIDVTTGRASPVAMEPVSWWGAAVTTVAPVLL